MLTTSDGVPLCGWLLMMTVLSGEPLAALATMGNPPVTVITHPG